MFNFADCGIYTCFILHVVHVLAFASLRGFLHFILHSSVCVFLLFIFPDTDQHNLGSVWCCFDVCFLTFDVSLWFFGFSFLTCILPFGFLAFVSVLFSCLFC